MDWFGSSSDVLLVSGVSFKTVVGDFCADVAPGLSLVGPVLRLTLPLVLRPPTFAVADLFFPVGIVVRVRGLVVRVRGSDGRVCATSVTVFMERLLNVLSVTPPPPPLSPKREEASYSLSRSHVFAIARVLGFERKRGPSSPFLQRTRKRPRKYLFSRRVMSFRNRLPAFSIGKALDLILNDRCGGFLEHSGDHFFFFSLRLVCDLHSHRKSSNTGGVGEIPEIGATVQISSRNLWSGRWGGETLRSNGLAREREGRHGSARSRKARRRHRVGQTEEDR